MLSGISLDNDSVNKDEKASWLPEAASTCANKTKIEYKHYVTHCVISCPFIADKTFNFGSLWYLRPDFCQKSIPLMW